MTDLKFACPHCRASLDSSFICPTCKTAFEYRDGIYRFLLSEREEELKPFLAQYQHIRQQEGNVAHSAEYYRSLPFVPKGGLGFERWYIRCQSFKSLLGLLPRHPIKMLDLGAGNCWLTNRLAELGNHCVAVDVSINCDDGLGAQKNYALPFTCVQADFDSLPFVSGQFDVVIFNASLHYSPDLDHTLAQANSVLKRDGTIFVIDSPTFRSDRTGKKMISDRDDRFQVEFGLREVIQCGSGYLTRKQMYSAGFRFHESNGGFLSTARRWRSGMKMRREPAAFGVWAGKPT